MQWHRNDRVDLPPINPAQRRNLQPIHQMLAEIHLDILSTKHHRNRYARMNFPLPAMVASRRWLSIPARHRCLRRGPAGAGEVAIAGSEKHKFAGHTGDVVVCSTTAKPRGWRHVASTSSTFPESQGILTFIVSGCRVCKRFTVTQRYLCARPLIPCRQRRLDESQGQESAKETTI